MYRDPRESAIELLKQLMGNNAAQGFQGVGYTGQNGPQLNYRPPVGPDTTLNYGPPSDASIGMGVFGKDFAPKTVSDILNTFSAADDDGWAGTIRDKANTENGMPPGGPADAQAPVNVLDQLFSQMLGQVGNIQSTDYEDILRDSEAAIRSAYGGQIGTLRGQNRQTRREANRNDKDLARMYEGLGNEYERVARAEGKNTRQDVRQLRRMGNRTANEIEGGAESRLQSQADMLKGLGVQDAAASVLTPQNENIASDLSAVKRNSAQDQSFANRWGATNRRFLNNGATRARLEGTNRRADLQSQLMDILGGNRDQIAELAGQRDMAIASNESDLMSQAASSQSEAANNAFNQMMQLANLRVGIEGQQNDQAIALQKLLMEQQGNSEAESYLPDSVNNTYGYLQSAVSPQYQPEVASAFESILASKPFQRGEFTVPSEDGRGPIQEFKLTPEKAMQVAKKAGEDAGLPPEVIQQLMNMARIYTS